VGRDQAGIGDCAAGHVRTPRTRCWVGETRKPGATARTFGGQTYSGDRYVPSLIFPRQVTLNPRVVEQAAAVVLVVHGAAKAEILASVLGEEIDVRRWPAQLARRDGATWFVDEAAASALPR